MTQPATQIAKNEPGVRFHIPSWVVLLGIIVGLLAVIELSVRFGIGRVSAIEHRVEQERKTALAIGNGPGARNTVLLVGNSLPLEDIDLPALQNAIAPDFRIVRYTVEQTTYLDWYYGLRSLYAAGARPAVVALSLNDFHMASDQVRGDYFAYRLMMTRDFLSAARDARLSATATASLLLGSLSAFYGTRSETRTVLLAKVMPTMQNLVPYLTPLPDKNPPAPSLLIQIASRRLATLDTMVRAHGGRFLFIVPATTTEQDSAVLAQAGTNSAVPVLIPLHSDSLSLKDFRDGFHLNPEGTGRYTASLGPMFKQAVMAALR